MLTSGLCVDISETGSSKVSVDSIFLEIKSDVKRHLCIQLGTATDGIANTFGISEGGKQKTNK